MGFAIDYDLIPQDLVKLTRPRDNFKSHKKRREKQAIQIQRTSLKIYLLKYASASPGAEPNRMPSFLKKTASPCLKIRQYPTPGSPES